MKKKILVISFSHLNSDPRPNRQIRFLRDDYDVMTLGFSDSLIEKVRHVPILMRESGRIEKVLKAILLKFHLFTYYYWRFMGMWDFRAKVDTQALKNEKFALIIANDIDALPLALHLANGRPVLFDAHEFAPREYENLFLWRFLFQRYKTYLCRKYIKKSSAMITVCYGIADEYQKLFSIHSEVITNAAEYADLKPGSLRDDTITLIHHGVGLKGRKLESMIDMMEYLDNRFLLSFMLVPVSPAYYESLKEKASRNPRISFVPPVAMKEIPSAINKFDIGVYILKPDGFNEQHSLPNKFFEFIQARLAIAIGPSSEMAAIVKKYDLGVVSEDFSPKEMARCLNELTKDKIQYYKNQSHRFARELSADENKKKLLKIVAGLI